MNNRPQVEEYFNYYQGYVDQAKGDDIVAMLVEGGQESQNFFRSIPQEKWDYRYGPDKWTIKEAVIHMMDTERIFAYRALRVGRNDPSPMPGFDQNEYAPFYNAATRSPESIMEEYQTIRAASISLFKNLQAEDLLRLGTASGHPTSCRAMGFILAGHEQHHLRIFRERYLKS